MVAHEWDDGVRLALGTMGVKAGYDGALSAQRRAIREACGVLSVRLSSSELPSLESLARIGFNGVCRIFRGEEPSDNGDESKRTRAGFLGGGRRP